jgi:DNA-binding NtrC family response regulator
MNPNKTTILIIDDEQVICDLLKVQLLSECSCNVQTFNDGRAAYPVLAGGNVAAVFLDWMMPFPGEEILKHITSNHPEVQVFVMTAIDDAHTAVNALKLGASNYMTKPLDTVRLTADANNAIKLFEANQYSRHLSAALLRGAANDSFGIVYNSEAMARIMLLIEGMSGSRQPVLITGETGTGKEGLARAIHASSDVKGDFVAVNVAGLDGHMFSDVFFGHRKGAFTGADTSVDGLVAKAEGGTLFLDEIGDLAEENQVKLLRLIQEKEYYRLGSPALMKCNIRVIAATNKNFNDKRMFKSFRQDLFFRLSTHPLFIPPLRERTDDISVLASTFIAESSKELGRTAPTFTFEALSLLENYSYPGNVRELKNIILDICIRNTSGIITANDFPSQMPRPVFRPEEISQLDSHPLSTLVGKFPTLEELEMYAIKEVMRITNNNQSATARILKMARPTLNKRLKSV